MRIVVVLFAMTTIVFAPVAHAGPDPHIPNPQTGYCPGGSMGSPIWFGYCDGEHYPDGTYWHTFQNGIPIYGHPNGALGTGGLIGPQDGPSGAVCVLDNDSPVPAAAGPGGCGGAA